MPKQFFGGYRPTMLTHATTLVVDDFAAVRDIPFIMVTAELQRDRVAEAIRARVHNFLLSPL